MAMQTALRCRFLEYEEAAASSLLPPVPTEVGAQLAVDPAFIHLVIDDDFEAFHAVGEGVRVRGGERCSVCR